MTMTATYDGSLSRVRLTCDGLSVFPVRVQRSTDGVRWATVRGGAAAVPAAGVVRLDDYEFTPGVPNTYRVLGPSVNDLFDRTASSSWGSTPQGQPWATAGGTATEFTVSGGEGKVAVASVGSLRRTTLTTVSAGDFDIAARFKVPVAATGTGDIITGITARLVDGGTYYYADLAWRPPNTGPGNLPYPTVETIIVSRVAAANTIIAQNRHYAQYAAGDIWWLRFKGTGSRMQATIWPDTSVPPVDTWLLDVTDTSIPAPGQVGTRMSLFTGNTNTLPVTLSTLDFLVLGPEAVAGQATITPTINKVWLKSVARPFLNRQVTVVDYSDVQRSARGGLFDVVGRSLPVSVTDVHGSRRWSLEVLADTLGDADDLDLLVASGDTLLVQAPAGSGVPEGYVSVGDTTQRRTSRLGPRRVLELPCVEVAAPGPDVVGSTVTCQTVLNAYATCQAVLDAHSTCLDLMDLVGDPTEVIVP